MAEDGLSASKPGEITAAAASLVSEMSSTDEVRTGVQYKPCYIDCRLGSAVCVSPCMCMHSMIMIIIMRACVHACEHACVRACMPMISSQLPP